MGAGRAHNRTAQVEELFVIWRSGPVTDGGRPVSWIAGEEVQRFANVHELLLGVNDHLRADLVEPPPA